MLRGLIHTGGVAQVRVDQIQVDGGTQMRAGLDGDTVQEYAEKMENGWGDFPSVVLFYDGTDYWLADGFHRLAAYKSLAAVGDTLIPADVRSGTRRDAILFAASANANHGLRRTKADKRRSVEVMLRDEEWQRWSNREIARRCAVDEKTVREIKRDLGIDTADNPQYTHPKTGQMTTMNTANIGAQRRYASGLPVLDLPAPGVGLAKLPMTEWELGDVVESVVREYYGEVERGVADGFGEVLASALAQAGGYWERLERALGPFAVTPEQAVGAVKGTVARLLAGGRGARGEGRLQNPDREEGERGRGAVVVSRSAEVWEIERALGGWAAGQRAGGLRAVARLRGGALWWEVRQVLQGLAPLTYRDRDLVQALNNVAAQREQAGAGGEGRAIETTIAPVVAYVVPAETVAAETGREGVDAWVLAWAGGARGTVDEAERRLNALAMAMEPWVLAWTDDKGRTWRDVTERNPQHANSPFRQDLQAECERRGLWVAGSVLTAVIKEVFLCLTSADEAERRALTADERTADFADDAEGKLLTEWTDADWATYATARAAEAAAVLTGETLANVLRPLVAEFYEDGSDSWQRHAALDMRRNASDKDGAFWRRCIADLGQAGYNDRHYTAALLKMAIGLLADEAPPIAPAVDTGWVREEERSVAVLPADIDQGRRMDASLAVDDRAGRLHGWLVRLLTLRSELVDWGELTGHHLETLAIGRELDKLVMLSQRELDMLTGAAEVGEVDGEREGW